MTSAFNITGVAESAVLAALSDTQYSQMILDTNAKERDRLTLGLKKLGFSPMPSATNFIGVDLHKPADAIIRALREQRIRVASFGHPSASTCIRVSTATAEDTDLFLAALPVVLRSI